MDTSKVIFWLTISAIAIGITIAILTKTPGVVDDAVGAATALGSGIYSIKYMKSNNRAGYIQVAEEIK